MKKIFSILLAGMALMSVVACSDSDYDERYADPSKTSTVGVPQVFTGVLYKANTWMNPIYYRYYTQSTTSGVFSGVIGNSNGKGRFMGAGEGYFNTRWKDFYDMLTQFRLLEKNYGEMDEAQQKLNAVFYHAARSVVDAQLHEMLSLFGDVPFKGAGMLWSIGYAPAKEQCAYDDDVTLYKQILAELKESADFFAGDVDGNALAALVRQDYTLAAGSKTKWQKYINTMRLRIALHLATAGDCTTEAKAAIAEILNNPGRYPLIDSNDDNMGVSGNTNNDTFNFGKSTSQALHTGSYSAGSQTMLNAMNVPATGVPDAGTDPRLDAMYDCNPDDQYVAYDVKMTDTQISNLADQKNQEYVGRGIVSSNYFCVIDTVAIAGWAEYEGNANLAGLWASAAEANLAKAEAYLMGYGVGKDEAKAKQCFVKGVELSTEFYWNLKTGSSLFVAGNDSHKGFRAISRPAVADVTAYAESVWQATQEAVVTQRWIDYSFMNELEAWNLVRRTGYPVVDFARDSQMSSYPTPPNRLPYPSDEINYNSANYQAAKAVNYKEETGYYTNLFWAKENYYNLVK